MRENAEPKCIKRIRTTSKIEFSFLRELLYARMMSEGEAMKRISDLRLGISLGIIKTHEESDMAKLVSHVGSAAVQKDSGEVMTVAEQEIRRAEIVRNILAQTKKS